MGELYEDYDHIPALRGIALKPCPFCGGEARFKYEEEHFGMIRCSECGCEKFHGYYAFENESHEDFIKHLIEDWNRREGTDT